MCFYHVGRIESLGFVDKRFATNPPKGFEHLGGFKYNAPIDLSPQNPNFLILPMWLQSYGNLTRNYHLFP